MEWVSKAKVWLKKFFVKTGSQNACDHKFAVKQVWTRIATRQFELQNEITCMKCSDRRVEAIR